jgi:hypothetical protein
VPRPRATPTDPIETFFSPIPPEGKAALREEVEAAFSAYHDEIDLLLRYGRKGRDRALLHRFAAGRLPLEGLPAGLRAEVEGRPAATLAPLGCEGEWEVLLGLGEPLEAMALARRYAEGRPSSCQPRSLATMRRRAGELLRGPFWTGRRLRAREQAVRHLAFVLSQIWWSSMVTLIASARELCAGGGVTKDSIHALGSLVGLLEPTPPEGGAGRPADPLPRHRAGFVAAAFRAHGLPPPSAAVLESLPALPTAPGRRDLL